MSNSERECKAKVFVSCGQSSESEVAAAKAVRQVLEDRKFEVYVAVHDTDVHGVTEILKHLKSSEYCLLIDFHRPGKCPPFSLFTHQELAIAYDRRIKTACFLQSPLKENGAMRQGMGKFLFVEPESFADPSEVPGKVKALIEQNECEWNPNWKNALEVTGAVPDNEDVQRCELIEGRRWLCKARFFQVRVRNKHEDRVARRCVAYLKSVTHAEGKKIDGEWPIEHKWAGYRFPEATIRPKGERAFDAFYIITEIEREARSTATLCSPDSDGCFNFARRQDWVSGSPLPGTLPPDVRGMAYFNTFTDYPGYQQPLPRGQYEFTYEILAEDFPATEAIFTVNIGTSVEDTTIERKNQRWHYR